MEVLTGLVVDACFPDASYVIECDGRRWHTIDADRAADVTRQGVLEADGWQIDRMRTRISWTTRSRGGACTRDARSTPRGGVGTS